MISPPEYSAVLSPTAKSRASQPWLLASLAYGALTIVFTWPLVTQITAVLPHDLGDPILNAWIVWWNAHVLPLTTRWWNGQSFWPSWSTVAFSETLLGLTPITNPIQWLGGSAITAYNVAFLLTFPLSALAAHALVFRLSGRHDAGFIAGLIYGFNPFRVGHISHIQVLVSCWMPIGLLGLHEFASTKRTRWLFVFAGAWLMQASSNGYYLLFFPVLIGVWILWFLASRANVRAVAAIVCAWAVASVPLVPILWTYRSVTAGYGFQRSEAEVILYSADVLSLFDASPLLKVWHLLHPLQLAEQQLFPGLTAVLLVSWVCVRWLRTRPRAASIPRFSLGFLIAGLSFIGIALSALGVGPWAIRIGTATLVSVGVVHKPLSIGLLLLILAIVVEPRFVAAVRRRSMLLFYVLAMLLMYLLCFGPRPKLLGDQILYRGPYVWLMALPGYSSIRSTGRFAMLAVLCLSVAAPLAFVRLTSRTRSSTRQALAALVIAGILADSWFGGLPLPSLPMRLNMLESLPADTAVIELPFGQPGRDLEALYRAIYHGHFIVNGYSGFFPRSFEFLSYQLNLREAQAFDALTAFGRVAVVVDRLADERGRWARQLTARPGTVSLGEESQKAVYLLSGADPPTPEPPTARRLRIQSASANFNSDEIALALDGDLETRWSTGGSQTGNEVVTVDLGSPQIVDGLTLTLGRYLLDFPRTLVIETEEAGGQWSTRWTGVTLPVTFAGIVRRPKEPALAFALPSVPTQRLRLRQIGRDPEFFWSIVELSVFGH